MELTRRPADSGDIETIFEWRNDPETRRNSQQTLPVGFNEHQRWFSRSLENPDREIWIYELDGSPVGLVRFDKEEGHMLMSAMMDPERRGEGIGKAMFTHSIRSCQMPVRAQVRLINKASVHILEAADMHIICEDGEWLTLSNEKAPD